MEAPHNSLAADAANAPVAPAAPAAPGETQAGAVPAEETPVTARLDVISPNRCRPWAAGSPACCAPATS